MPQVARCGANITEDTDVGRSASKVIGMGRPANATVMAAATAGGVNTNSAVVACDVVDRGVQSLRDAAAAGGPFDARGTARNIDLGTREEAEQGYRRGQTCYPHGFAAPIERADELPLALFNVS
jgi:hypothetical protein